MREWDLTAVTRVPELEAAPVAELEFLALGDGTLRLEGGGPVPEGALARLAAEVERGLSPPYAARAARVSALEWTVGARSLRTELIQLPEDLRARSIEVAVSPAGERECLVDGEAVPGLVHPSLDEALEELERRGRLRFEAFAARADKVDEARWALTIDPL